MSDTDAIVPSALPDRPELATPEMMVQLERAVALHITEVEDVVTADELRRRAQALETYLQGREGHGHAQGIARRTEARIGELLGSAKVGDNEPGLGLGMTKGSSAALRSDFRKLASKVRRGVLDYQDDGDDSPWRASRRALLLGAGAHVGSNTGYQSWYTPPEYLETARVVMGGIDLDPASSDTANTLVKADRYFTAADDGLAQPWTGRVWLNPPYDMAWPFCEKLCDHYADGDIEAAVLLVNNATETATWHRMAEIGQAICFPRGRIKFLDTDLKEAKTPLQGQGVWYFGRDVDLFRTTFTQFGFTVTL